MIVSSGYNIDGPEVEAALLSHVAVEECAVIGITDEERGAFIEAHVVLSQGDEPSEELIRGLQDHVKATIAPLKYPRSVVSSGELSKMESGKVQRFKLWKART